jgi:hypothetical protein
MTHLIQLLASKGDNTYKRKVNSNSKISFRLYFNDNADTSKTSKINIWRGGNDGSQNKLGRGI